MAPGANLRFIVRVVPGPGTAESYYEDNHGDWWRTSVGPPASGGTTGVTHGTLHSNGVIETRRK